MKYVRLGNSGLQVSQLALGCMSYGTPDTGQHRWTLGEDDATPFIRTAVEAGINFFDTVNSRSSAPPSRSISPTRWSRWNSS